MPNNRSTRSKWMAALFAAVGVVAFATPADAFYWYGWPGGPKKPPTVTPPEEEPPPVDPPKEPPPTTVTPEPGTAMAALIGLGALAAWRRTRRQVTETPTSTS